MCLAFWRLVQRSTHDVGTLGRVDLWKATRARRIFLDSREPLGGIPTSPTPRLLSRDAHGRGDLLILETVRRKQDNRCTFSEAKRIGDPSGLAMPRARLISGRQSLDPMLWRARAVLWRRFRSDSFPSESLSSSRVVLSAQPEPRRSTAWIASVLLCDI